ncbi:TetR/AcrR family transcriptional regulator [Pseudaminobacter salicylatoxidans]|uniref:TetR/AcrR family transcriptional regulator n=1 Tax=Pseudaminobacter salicylatoxidans TaxID=93369 RepID=UPI00036E58A4|nr:TetR/AcrR family transcriptional regulator [Pseudaminobacter salicylatoxidans]
MIGTTTEEAAANGADVRERVLETASKLFYERSVRAVGVDLVVAEAGVAKTSLYRHFRTKDDLIAAFLMREDEDFWNTWEAVAQKNAADPISELEAHLLWIGERVGRPNYRGCPQINVAAEFPEADHPARKVAYDHKAELRRRLTVLAERLGARKPGELGGQLAVLVNGAFVSSQMLTSEEAIPLLQHMAHALVEAGCVQDAKPCGND